MNRRAFLQRVCEGVVGTAVAAHVPLSWIPDATKQHAACAYLRRIFNEHYAQYRTLPVCLFASEAVADAFEDEVVSNGQCFLYSRDDGTPVPLFKGVKVHRIRSVAPWFALAWDGASDEPEHIALALPSRRVR